MVYIVFRCSKLWGQEVLRVYANHDKARKYLKEQAKEHPHFSYIICPNKVIF